MANSNEVLNSIRWGVPPGPIQCPWYESSYAREVTSYVLLALSGASLGGTYYFSHFSVQPGFARRFTITSFMTAVLAIFLRQIPFSRRDPAYILQQRQLIHENLQKMPGYGYKDIPQGFLSEAENKKLIRADIETLSYTAFKEKHGPEGLALSIAAFPDITKTKVFEHVKEKVLSHESDFEAAWASCFDKVNIAPNKLQSWKADCQALLLVAAKGNAQEFVQKADIELITSITESEAIEYLLKGKTLENIDTDQSLLGLGWKVVALASKLQKYREPLRARFLNLPYELLTDAKYETERQFLGIDATAIKETLRQRWESTSYIDEKFDRKGFLLSIRKEFSPKEWTQKILSDTRHLSVFAIARRWPELFTWKILTSFSAAPQNLSIWKRLHEEILDCGTWEKFVETFPPVLSERKVINVNTSAAVAFLALSYIYSQPRAFLGFIPPRYGPRALRRMPGLDSLMPSSLLELKSHIRKEFISREKQKEGVEELLKSMSPYQMAAFLNVNDFARIVTKIETDALLCKRFAACLYENRNEPGYAKLKEDFVQWVETKACEGKLSLVFAWNINSVAEGLFKTKIRFINNGNQLIPISIFVLHALASDKRNFLSGVLGTSMIEGKTSEICTNWDTSSFEGLMEYYKTGTLKQYLESYKTDEKAITRLWELADKLCLAKLQELLKQEFDLTVDLPKEEASEAVKEESKSHGQPV